VSRRAAESHGHSGLKNRPRNIPQKKLSVKHLFRISQIDAAVTVQATLPGNELQASSLNAMTNVQ